MLSIIIPCFNQHEVARDCIRAVIENTAEPFEIVLVDNGSDPGYSPADIGGHGVIIRNEKNTGFPCAINQGVHQSKGEVIILLNDDCIVTPGWAESLTGALDRFDIVGPMTNYAAGIQQVSLPVYYNETELNFAAKDWAAAHAGETQEVNWVIGFCMAFKRSLFDEVGAFDESLWPCSGEEIDFCYRAKMLGKKIAVVKDVYVHHFGGTTFKDLERAGQISSYKDICDMTDRHLNQKWGKGIFDQEIDLQASVPLGSIRLNLGCGFAHVGGPGWVNIDNRPECNPDMLCDVLEGLPYDDNTVDEVRAYDFLEHVPAGNVIALMNEIWRVLKPGGMFNSQTPSTDGRGAFQDPTHVSFWNINSWLYYSDDAYRNIYGIKADFEILKAEDTIPDPKFKVVHTIVTARARKAG